MPDAVADNACRRKCVASGEVLSTDLLIRFVRAPDGRVVPDLKHKLPGRGVWVSRNASCVARAQATKLFNRGFKAPCQHDGDLAGLVDQLLTERCLGYLSLANKAGQVVQGFEKVLSALKGEKLSALIGASDGARDGRDKLKARLHGLGLQDRVSLIEIFDSSQLGLALGRTNVIHAGVNASDLACKFTQSAQDLARYRSPDHCQSAESYKERA